MPRPFAVNLFDNAATPSLAVTVPTNMSPDGARRMEAYFSERATGAANARRPLFLENGQTVTPLSLSPEDTEVLASRRFSVAEVARLFSIPEPMLQTGPTAPATLTPYLAAFATLALLPIVALLESEFDSILPPGQHLALDLGGMLRGDYTAVAGAQAVLVQSGIATPNDARRALGLPAHPDGGSLGSGASPSYPADQAGVPSLAPKPGPTGSGLPNVDTNQGEGSGG